MCLISTIPIFSGNYFVYTVGKDDTAKKIVDRFNISLPELSQNNNIPNINKIRKRWNFSR